MGVSKWMMASVVVLVSSSMAFADKLDDFKRAVGETGCKTIPYSDLQENCGKQGEPMHDYCDAKKGPVTCDREGISRELTNNLEKEKRNLDDLKRKRSDLDDKKSRSSDDNEKNKLQAEIDQVDKDIYAAGKAIDAAKDAIDKRKELVNNSIYNLGKCLDYRKAVMNTFGYAQDKVRGENDTPEITELARKLRDMYEEEKRGHNIAITYKENALATCKNETL
jgi:DNA repair exonuclease SbcCD ATPase subunit